MVVNDNIDYCLHIFYAFMTCLFFNFFKIKNCVVHLQIFSNCHKSQKNFPVYLLKKKKSIHKATHMVQTCVVRRFNVIAFSASAQPPSWKFPLPWSMWDSLFPGSSVSFFLVLLSCFRGAYPPKQVTYWEVTCKMLIFFELVLSVDIFIFAFIFDCLAGCRNLR